MKEAIETIAEWYGKRMLIDYSDEDCARDLLRALDAAGYVVVPKEPTWEMLEAGQEQVNLEEEVGKYEYLSRDEIESIYAAMLSASTKEPPSA